MLAPLVKGWDVGKSLEDYVYRQKPYDNIAWMPPHSTENDQQLNRPLRRSTRLTSPVHHPKRPNSKLLD
eukprot:scaffold16083_cov77-Skeletonema_marinoi.AAC.1